MEGGGNISAISRTAARQGRHLPRARGRELRTRRARGVSLASQIDTHVTQHTFVRCIVRGSHLTARARYSCPRSGRCTRLASPHAPHPLATLASLWSCGCSTPTRPGDTQRKKMYSRPRRTPTMMASPRVPAPYASPSRPCLLLLRDGVSKPQPLIYTVSAMFKKVEVWLHE